MLFNNHLLQGAYEGSNYNKHTHTRLKGRPMLVMLGWVSALDCLIGRSKWGLLQKTGRSFIFAVPQEGLERNICWKDNHHGTSNAEGFWSALRATF